MSVLTVGGRRFAAELYWLEREGAASVARNARAFKRPWHVHWGGQTGYAADEESPKGCPSLAASLQAHIGVPTWMALVEADDGRLALVVERSLPMQSRSGRERRIARQWKCGAPAALTHRLPPTPGLYVNKMDKCANDTKT